MRKYIPIFLLAVLFSPVSTTAQTIDLGLEGQGGIWAAAVPNNTFALIKIEGTTLIMVVLHPYEVSTLEDLLAISELPDWEAYTGFPIIGETGETSEGFALQVAQFEGSLFSPNVVEATLTFLGESSAALEMVSCTGPFCLFPSSTTTLFERIF